MLINDLDARTTYGVTITDAPGWADAPPRMTPSAAVLKRGGARALGEPRDQPRQISIRGWIHGTSTQDARDKGDALKLALERPSGAKLSFDDYPTRYVMARCESCRIPALSASMITSKLQFEATFTAHDPYSYDNALTSFVTASIRMPLGTGPVRPIVTITGAITNPLLQLNNTAGAAVGSMQLTVTTVGGDVLIIDSDAKTIKLNGVNRLDLLTTGDFFLVDPADPQHQGLGPDLVVTGAGAATKNTSYRKSWR